MNAAYVHLTLNIFPPVLELAGLAVLAVSIALRSRGAMRTALSLLVASSLLAVPVYLSGEPAEGLVKGLDGVTTSAIHPHEEAAEFAFIVLIVQGLLALAALLLSRRRELPSWALIVIVIVTVAGAAAIARTAFLGGKIHHPESGMR